MKICYLDKENQKMLLSLDYWDAESLGYDVKKMKDLTGNFHRTVLDLISNEVKKVFGENFNYGIKTYVDDKKGKFYYEIKPYAERIDEFIMEEMVKRHYAFMYLFPYGI